MKVSLHIVRQLMKREIPPIDELVRRINEQLGGVEETKDLNAQYKDARIVRVVTCVKHPNADHLSITTIDDGGAVADVPRDENGYVQVVCGAPNVHADMWAIWLPPRSTVPASFFDSEPFVLDARKLRGILSQGMLAASDELAIGVDHQGIVEITENDLHQGQVPLHAGDSFAETFGLNDWVVEIENKMFTHRPDCFGQLGVARELSAILSTGVDKSDNGANVGYRNPTWYDATPKFREATDLSLIVKNEVSEKVPRLMAVALRDVTVKPSPLWLQCALVSMGGKPINNVVDITNYMMLMTAQPVHAYDYDKIHGQTLVSRMAKSGESVALLNGKTYELSDTDIVIADAEGAIGLAGIMGGGDSEVNATTKNIVLEVATFDMYTVRKTSMRHGVFTEALTRFNKGQSPLQNDRILARLMEMAQQLSGAIQASTVFDEGSNNWKNRLSLNDEIAIDTSFINNRLGSSLSAMQISQLLKRVDFVVHPLENDAASLLISAPFWRTDIELPEDLVEEVGRLYGFDRLPRMLPMRSITPAPRNARRVLKQRVRGILARAGANEVLNYSFVHERVLSGAGLDVARAYKLNNALSPRLQYYRLSVLPSLLDDVHANVKAGHNKFMLFEIGKGHDKKLPLNDEMLPTETDWVDAVYTSKKPQLGAAYFRAQRIVRWLLAELHVSAHVAARAESAEDLPLFEPMRTACIVAEDGAILGMVGELKATVRHNFKLPDYTAAFSLNLALIEAHVVARGEYHPLSRYPSTSRDVTLQTDTMVTYQAIEKSLYHAIAPFIKTVAIDTTTKSIYQSSGDSAHIATTFHMELTSFDRTLTDADVEPILQAIDRVTHDECGAVRI